MTDERRELAVITDAIYGMSEGFICLTFEIHLMSGYCSTIRLGEEQASEMIKEANVHDVHKLNLMLCWVKVRNGCCYYDGMFEPELLRLQKLVIVPYRAG